MDFQLNEEHRMVQKMVRDFTHKEVIPIIKEWDRKQEMAPHILPRMCLRRGHQMADRSHSCPIGMARSRFGSC